MSVHEHAPSKPQHSLIVHYLERSERVVLALIAIVLVVLAVLLLMSNIVGMVQSLMDGSMSDKAIEILDGVLLVMMTMEIVYTVTLSLQSHKLVAEPFLVIGIIAAIRRTLVITAEGTKFETDPKYITDPAYTQVFRSMLLELALLAVIVGVMAAAIWMIRRSNQYLKDDEMVLTED